MLRISFQLTEYLNEKDFEINENVANIKIRPVVWGKLWPEGLGAWFFLGEGQFFLARSLQSWDSHPTVSGQTHMRDDMTFLQALDAGRKN